MLIVYDLDLTLTDTNYGDKISEAWKSRTNYDAIKQMLQQQQRDGHILAILSRGVRCDVIKFLDNVKLLHLFTVVIGAKSISENRNNTDSFWGELKTKFLKALSTVYGDDIVFADDKTYNIQPARRARFKVLHIKPPGSQTTVKLMHNYFEQRTERQS